MIDPRKQLADTLRDVLNDGRKLRAKYLIIDNESSPATIDRRTVLLSLQGFEPLTAAPLGDLKVEYLLRVLSPKPGLKEAEVDAWDAALDIARAIEGIDGADWKSARKIIAADKYLGYDITVETYPEWKEPS